MTLSTTPTGVRLEPDQLKKLFLFESLDDDKLAWLAERAWVAEAKAEDTLLEEGAPAELVILLLSGTITLGRKVGPDDVEMVRSDQHGAYAGAMQSYLAGAEDLTDTGVPQPTNDVPGGFDEASKAFDARLRERHPLGSPVAELRAALASEGFKVDNDGVARLMRPGFLCQLDWSVRWTERDGRIGSIEGQHDGICF